MSALFLAAAFSVVAIATIVTLTLEVPLTTWDLALFFALNLVLIARYLPWSRLPASNSLRADLPWLALGAGIVFLIALLLQSGAELYFYLLAVEGCCCAFPGPLARILWIVTVAGLVLLSSLPFAGWPAAGLLALRALPVYAAFVLLAEIATLQESRRGQVETLLQELAAAHRRLQDYTAQAEALAVAAERTRLAREIHDTLGHTLTALDIQLELLGRLPESQLQARLEAAETARRLVRQGLFDLRRAIDALGPGALEAFSLPEAIAALVSDFRGRNRIDVAWQVEGEPVPVPGRIGLPLFRAVQEALTNVSRYADAHQVRVTLRFDTSQVTVRVEDDGRGGDAPFGYGLRGLMERAEALGGRLQAGPATEKGFHLEMQLPR